MMDTMIQTLEDKVMALVNEMEELRKDMQRVKQENIFLKTERENQRQKLQGLISLLESVDAPQESSHVHEHVFAHGRKEEVIAL